LIDDVLVSLSIYHSIEASNLGVFSSVLDEALDFLLAILEVTAAIRLLVFHVAETIHNTVEACAHLVTRISDIRISFVTQIAKTSFRSETVVKDFSTNTGNIFCYPTDFLSNSTSSIRDIFVDTCLCFLNRSFYFLNISFVSLILSHTETAAAPKPPPTNAPPTAPHPEPQPE
jgi:hypothetical protein